MTARQLRIAMTSGCTIAAAIALSSCSTEPRNELSTGQIEVDPLLAKALNDPLMVDPDLAYRNEANSAVTVRYDHPLPPLSGSPEMAMRARDAARVALLEGGTIADLPFPKVDPAPATLAEYDDARAIAEALNAPASCAQSLEAGLIWAARMPGPSSIMPHGMVQQAAGTDAAGCTLRVVRYITPVTVEDALQYHYTLADRARVRPDYFETPEAAIIGDGRVETLAAFARPGPGDLTSVDLVYWTK